MTFPGRASEAAFMSPVAVPSLNRAGRPVYYDEIWALDAGASSWKSCSKTAGEKVLLRHRSLWREDLDYCRFHCCP